MIVVDAGHSYLLDHLSANPERRALTTQPLQFVKRVGDGYPGNNAPGCEGTNCQEVLRALIDRCMYLHGQVPCAETEAATELLRAALLLFELRAARRHGRSLDLPSASAIAGIVPCPVCGHIGCNGHDNAARPFERRRGA